MGWPRRGRLDSDDGRAEDLPDSVRAIREDVQAAVSRQSECLRGRPTMTRTHIEPTALCATECPVCRGTRSMVRLYENGRGHVVFLCERCDVVVLDSQRQVSLLTDEHYYDAEMERFYRAHQDRFQRTAKEYLAEVERRVGRVAGKRLLDIGAGLGHFLDVAANAGADVEGLDIRDSAVRFLEARGYSAHHSLIHEFADKAPAAYDIVTAWNVIEHDDAPRRFVQSALALLRPGGVLVLETPDNLHVLKRLAYRYFGMVPARYRPVLPNLHTDTGHRFGFCPESLEELLTSVGFEECGSAGSAYDDKLMLKKIAARGTTTRQRVKTVVTLAPGFALMRLLGIHNRFLAHGRKPAASASEDRSRRGAELRH